MTTTKALLVLAILFVSFFIVGCSNDEKPLKTIKSEVSPQMQVKPVCGNGIAEEGETGQTCCKDAGCEGQQTCFGQSCIDPICGNCQYLEDHVCKDYACCTNANCAFDEICENNACTGIECGQCKYATDHMCVAANCCVDNDCSDDEFITDDACINPGTEIAKCDHKITRCQDSTAISECNAEGKRCSPSGVLQLDSTCDSYKKLCFRDDRKVAIVEFVAPNVDQWPEWEGYKFIDLLNNDKPFVHFEQPSPSRDVYSVNYIPVWYSEQAARYEQSVRLDMEIIGPYYLTEFPPLEPFKRAQQVYLNVTYLKQYAENKGINLSEYDRWIPLYLYKYYKLDGEEGTTLHPNSGAISFQIDSYYYPIPWVISTIAHELAHLFCAADRYIRYSCKHPEGVPNPDVYPQEKACLMCDKIMYTKEGSGRTIDTMSEIVVCEATAKEFGWIN